jgi:predicted RNA-binding Zn ribbon-like protein
MIAAFSFDSGSLALDLLNTWARPEADDGLRSPAALLEWLSSAGLLSPERHAELRGCPPDARTLLTEVLTLRMEVRSALEAMKRARPAPESAVLVLNRVLRARRSSLSLERDAGQLSLVETHDGRALRSILSPVAEAAAELLLHGDRARIRQCHAEDCASWFSDTSKNGRRKWCSMARCGNRAKAAAHYRRHREG